MYSRFFTLLTTFTLCSLITSLYTLPCTTTLYQLEQQNSCSLYFLNTRILHTNSANQPAICFSHIKEYSVWHVWSYHFNHLSTSELSPIIARQLSVLPPFGSPGAQSVTRTAESAMSSFHIQTPVKINQWQSFIKEPRSSILSTNRHNMRFCIYVSLVVKKVKS